MARRPKILRKRDHSGVYLLAACCVVAGVLLFGLRMLSPAGDVAGDREKVREVAEVSQPSVQKAPEPVKKESADKKAKAAKEKAAKEKAAKEKAAKEKAEKEKAEDQEIAQAPAPADAAMYLTVPKMGKYDEPVGGNVDEATLYNGPGHAPQSGYPWQPGSNTYIAGHVLGYSGTGSYLDFADLPSMTYGDEISIKDSNGTTYTYTVSDVLQVSIYETWVINPTGKDQISLQTCINPPAYDVRLVVRGDLVDVTPA